MKKTKKRKHLLHFSIAGFTYYEGAIAFSHLKIGSKLKLVPEPENKYDANAVALYFKEYKLGYIPKSDNRTISAFLELKINHFEARVQFLDKTEHPENQVGVIIYVVK